MTGRLAKFAAQATDDLLHSMLIEGKITWSGEDTGEMRGTEEAVARLKQPGQQPRFSCRQWEGGVAPEDDITLWIKPEISAQLDGR
jgi:hypothetical protein